MDARKQLKIIQVLQAKIEQRREQAEELRARVQSFLTPKLSIDRIQTSKVHSPMEEQIIRYLDIEKEVERLTLQLDQEKDKIIGLIHSLDDRRYILILYKSYVEGKPLKEVAIEMGFSYEWARHLKVEAEKSFVNTTHKNTTKCDIV